MFIATAVVAVLLALALVGSAVGKLTRQPKVVEGITGVGVPVERLPALAALELLGAVGLIVGLWIPAIGVAAGVGVVLYFLGAVIAHVRVGDTAGIGAPVVLLLVALASIVLRVLSA